MTKGDLLRVVNLDLEFPNLSGLKKGVWEAGMRHLLLGAFRSVRRFRVWVWPSNVIREVYSRQDEEVRKMIRETREKGRGSWRG